MTATDFEYRHQTLVHQFIVAAAFLTYLVDREDIVWRFVKDSSAPRELERFFFIVAAVFIVVGAAICTWARVYRRPESSTDMESYRRIHRSRYFGDLLYAIGLASLVPLWGFIILVVAEALRVFRLIQRGDPWARNLLQDPFPAASPLRPPAAQESHSRLGKAFRQEAVNKMGTISDNGRLPRSHSKTDLQKFLPRPVFLPDYCSMHPYSVRHEAPLRETITPDGRLQLPSSDL